MKSQVVNRFINFHAAATLVEQLGADTQLAPTRLPFKSKIRRLVLGFLPVFNFGQFGRKIREFMNDAEWQFFSEAPMMGHCHQTSE